MLLRSVELRPFYSRPEPQLHDPSSPGGATPSPRAPAPPGQQRPQVGGGEDKPPEVLIEALPLSLEGV